MKRKRGILLTLGVGVGLSQVREFLMYNLNYQIDHVSRGTPFSYAHSRFRAVAGELSLAELNFAKWAISALLVVLMLLFTLHLARLVFGNSRYAKTLSIAYGIACFSSLLLHALATYHSGFSMAGVQLLHALQYPILMFVLILAAPLAKYKRSTP